MEEFEGQRTVCQLMRKGTHLAAVVALSFVLTACGGGDDSPAASAPASSRGAQPAPAGSPTSPGGALVDAGGAPSAFGEAPADAPSSAEGEDSGAAVGTGSVTLSWLPPTMNDDGSPLKLTGYRIYWGTSDADFEHSVVVDNPGLTRYVVEQLTAGTWFFVATALSDDRESEFSNVFSMTVR